MYSSPQSYSAPSYSDPSPGSSNSYLASLSSPNRLEYFAKESYAQTISSLEGNVAYTVRNFSPPQNYLSSAGAFLPYSSLTASNPLFAYTSSFHSVKSGSYSPETSSLLYQTTSKQSDLEHFSAPSHLEYNFHPETFLKPGKDGKFIGKAEEIREFVEEVFEKMFDQSFPEDIKISLCPEKEFRKIAPHPGTVGLSINRREQGLLSEIFVLEGSLGKVLLTLGHELGHVLSKSLNSKPDEEAKAYAFSQAWMEVIKEHNIAGLGNAFIEESPARNGLHDVAFAFVSRLFKSGDSSWQVWRDLAAGRLTISG